VPQDTVTKEIMRDVWEIVNAAIVGRKPNNLAFSELMSEPGAAMEGDLGHDMPIFLSLQSYLGKAQRQHDDLSLHSRLTGSISTDNGGMAIHEAYVSDQTPGGNSFPKPKANHEGWVAAKYPMPKRVTNSMQRLYKPYRNRMSYVYTATDAVCELCSLPDMDKHHEQKCWLFQCTKCNLFGHKMSGCCQES
jgi:hypothetical protein